MMLVHMAATIFNSKQYIAFQDYFAQTEDIVNYKQIYIHTVTSGCK